MKKVVNFVVSIEVETESVESPICEESLRENLFSAIENERGEGALTVSDISVNWIKVDSVGKETSNGEEVDGENSEKKEGMYSVKCSKCSASLIEHNSTVRISDYF